MFKKFLSKETKDWGHKDDDGFVELKARKEVNEDLGIPMAFKEKRVEAGSVKDRLEKMTGVTSTPREEVVSVRDRLESLKERPKLVRRPIEPTFPDMNKKEEGKKVITPESVMQKKIEKAMSKIEEYKKKMHNSPNSYLSLFYDLKQAEKDFLTLLEEADSKSVTFSGTTLSRIEKVKKQIRA